MLLLILIPACIGYFIYAAIQATEIRKSRDLDPDDTRALIGSFLVAGGMPFVVALVMTYLFLIQGGATTVQFNVGSPSRMNVWSTWVNLWPPFLLLTAISGIGNLGWAIRCAVTKRLRSRIVIAVAACLLSGLAFFTVASYFPSS